MKATRRSWNLCPTCKFLVFEKGLGSHKCPHKVKAKLDAELDMFMDDVLRTWDKDVQKFWNSKDVQFYEWEIEKQKDE